MKYRILRLFFPERDLNRILDINRLDFEDSAKIIRIKAQKMLSVEEYNFFRVAEDNEYGLKYELARQMTDILKNHIKVSEVFDIDMEQYICLGEIDLVELKEE